ncbi:MAG: acyl carrier protein [Clostridia bacterium]|nr:acyl carrier protein [Clostridia bacterium]MEE0410113.1 acyl carrier protein [Clostridia bacterium]
MVTVEELKEIFHTVFGSDMDLSAFNENSDLRKDVGMNSISLLYMAMVLEEKYGVKFTNSDFENMNTVADVIRKIQEQG